MKKIYILIILILSLVVSCSSYTNPNSDISIAVDNEFVAYISNLSVNDNVKQKSSLTGFKDGVINPYKSYKKINDKWNLEINEKQNYTKYFDESIYSIVPHQSYQQSSVYGYSVDKYYSNNKWHVEFFPISDEQSALPSSFVDSIYSNGEWSYVLNMSYIGNKIDKSNSSLAYIFYALHNINDYQYTIYYDEYNIFFMSKKNKFNNEYLNNFKNYEGTLFLFE
jgi:thiamine pyrophosphokinase